MKKSIIILGIAVLTFTNVISALAQQSFIQGDSMAQTTTSSNASLTGKTHGNPLTEKRSANEERDSENVNLEIIAVTAYQKTMEEIIAENNQIIESIVPTEQVAEDNSSQENQINISIEGYSFNGEKAMEDVIAQDSQIIENPVLNASLPITLGKSKKSKK